MEPARPWANCLHHAPARGFPSQRVRKIHTKALAGASHIIWQLLVCLVKVIEDGLVIWEAKEVKAGKEEAWKELFGLMWPLLAFRLGVYCGPWVV